MTAAECIISVSLDQSIAVYTEGGPEYKVRRRGCMQMPLGSANLKACGACNDRRALFRIAD